PQRSAPPPVEDAAGVAGAPRAAERCQRVAARPRRQRAPLLTHDQQRGPHGRITPAPAAPLLVRPTPAAVTHAQARRSDAQSGFTTRADRCGRGRLTPVDIPLRLNGTERVSVVMGQFHEVGAEPSAGYRRVALHTPGAEFGTRREGLERASALSRRR